MAEFSLLDSSVERWREILDLYDKVLKARAKDKKKDKAKELIELDKWFQIELPAEILKRSEKHLTKEEVTKLMMWKLSRGKFRPRLVELIKSNSEEKILDCTKTAFQLLPNVAQAIKKLSELSGVGPATASAILCAGCPEVPFMADEAMLALPLGRGKLEYTPKAYLQYLDILRSRCLLKLQKKDPDGKWNEHKVELALWTQVTASKFAPELLSANSPAGKRKDETRTDSATEDKAIKRRKK